MRRMLIGCGGVGLAVALAGGGWLAGRAQASTEQTPSAARARVVVDRPLPQLDGTRLGARLVEVTYDPGGASTPHSHPCPVVGYVLDGAVRMKVGDEPEATYAAGQTFYEPPNGAHLVSANANRERPARFLAFFVCDTDAPLSGPVPKGRGGR